jgi:hypothetical protein
MATAKDVIVKVIPSKIANEFVKKHHYSGKVVANSQLHFGCFLENRLHGVMSFGCSLDKRKVQGLVVNKKTKKPALWNEWLELNRMAFDDALPRNSESRCISIAFRLIKKNAPHIRWIISFADGAHCGDGTIYRASGFKLTNLSTASMIELPEKYWKYNGGGKYAHRMSLQAKSSMMYKIMQRDLGLNGEYKTMEWYAEHLHTNVVEGYQLRYIYVLDPDYEIACEIIPFSKIDELNAGMYKGQKITQKERHIDKNN